MVTTYLQYNEEVLRDFFKFQVLKKSKLKWVYFGLSFVCFTIGLLEAIVWNKLLLGIIISLLSVALVAFFPIQVNNMVKREVKNMINHVDVKLEFDNVGCKQYVSEKRFCIDEWEKFCEVVETKKYIYFYTNKYEAVIVSKAILKGNDYDNLLAMVHAHSLKFIRK